MMQKIPSIFTGHIRYRYVIVKGLKASLKIKIEINFRTSLVAPNAEHKNEPPFGSVHVFKAEASGICSFCLINYIIYC